MFSKWTSFTQPQKTFLLGWATFLIVASGATLFFAGGQQHQYLKDSINRHAVRVGASGNEKGQTDAEKSPPLGHESDVPKEVRVGVYVDRIPQLSIIGSAWKADFYLWFDWEGADLNPGETFHIVSGEILSKTVLEKKTIGKRQYALYRVTAEITKTFDVARFPRDDHVLTISIEDTASQSYTLKYMADDAGSDISTRVAVPGYNVVNKAVAVRPHSYRTSRGNPDLPLTYKATYSQFMYGIWISRPTWGLYFKMFIVMYIAVLIALLGFFVKSSSDRLVLVSGSLFAAVASMYITSTMIPDTGIATLADQINCIGAGFILVAVVQAVIYQYHFEDHAGKESVARFFDFMSFGILFVLYSVLNICIPLLASS